MSNTQNEGQSKYERVADEHFARVCEVCRHGIVWYDTVAALQSEGTLLKAVSKQFDFGSAMKFSERVVEGSVTRAAHHSVILAWDALQGMSDDLCLLDTSGKTKSKYANSKESRKWSWPKVQENLSDLQRSDLKLTNVGTDELTYGGIFELRNTLAHCLSHPTGSLVSEKTRTNQVQHWRGPKVDLLYLSSGTFKQPNRQLLALEDSATSCVTYQWELTEERWLIPISRNDLMGLLSTIRLLAWLLSQTTIPKKPTSK